MQVYKQQGSYRYIKLNNAFASFYPTCSTAACIIIIIINVLCLNVNNLYKLQFYLFICGTTNNPQCQYFNYILFLYTNKSMNVRKSYNHLIINLMDNCLHSTVKRPH